jgi:transposase
MDRKDPVTLSQREQQRLRVVMEVNAGNWSTEQASEVLRLSVRQVWRLKAGYEKEGAAAFMHGNRGRASPGRIGEAIRSRVIELMVGQYAGCNDHHLAELLAQREGIVLSRKTVERIRREAGLKPARRRRPGKHRQRRERMPQEGMMLQVDGSLHRWFGPDEPPCTLLAAIDDATGKVVAAIFRAQEDAQGYLLLLRQVLKAKGIPLGLYHDRHSIFQDNSKRPWTLEEELQGQREPTQFGRALEELGITAIAAHSPQAKGRVERLWGTWQDRLVQELRLAGVIDIRAGNRFLPKYLGRFNARFAVQADEPGQAYRPLDARLDLHRILSFRYQRVVAMDNTVRLEGRLIQVPPGPKRRSYAGARVWVHELLDGSVGVWYQDGWLARTSARDEVTLRARSRAKALPQRPEKPQPQPLPLPEPEQAPKALKTEAASHPWRRYNPQFLKPRSVTESLSR